MKGSSMWRNWAHEVAPVHLGRLDGFVWHGLERGEEDEIDECRPLPDVDAGHGKHRKRWHRQPEDLLLDDPQLLEDEVQQAVFGCIDRAGRSTPAATPGMTIGMMASDVDRCLHGCRADRPVDEQGKAQPEQDLGWDDDETVDRRLAYGFASAGLLSARM